MRELDRQGLERTAALWKADKSKLLQVDCLNDSEAMEFRAFLVAQGVPTVAIITTLLGEDASKKVVPHAVV